MRGFSTLDNPSHKGQTDVWLTPLWIIERLGGGFDLDPCGYPGHQTAKKLFLENEGCGLSRDWGNKFVWLNPPYSDVGRWLDKLADHANGTALVFARTDTSWAQRHFKRAANVFFLKGRIKFLRADFTESTNAGHGSMILHYGQKRKDFNFEGWQAK